MLDPLFHDARHLRRWQIDEFLHEACQTPPRLLYALPLSLAHLEGLRVPVFDFDNGWHLAKMARQLVELFDTMGEPYWKLLYINRGCHGVYASVASADKSIP